ncbi:hypothetical protein ACT8ZV_06370 [Nocardioides sp. MAHUQ-72]|uniref:hypothetical protein n=1 Tax=unclassified Nocardioides TaxID=2615069 RepID=UPI003620AB6F
MIRAWPRSQWLLRAVVATGPLVALLATAPAGAPPYAWLVVLVAGLSVAHARSPESPFGTGALGAVVIWWGVALHDGVPGWALVAAAALLASHVAALLASYGPETMAVDPATARLWLRRAAAAFLLAPLALVLTVGVGQRPGTPVVWVVGMAVALAVGVVATLAVTRDAG